MQSASWQTFSHLCRPQAKLAPQICKGNEINENSSSSFSSTHIVALPFGLRAVDNLLLAPAVTVLQALAAAGRTLTRTMAALVALVLATRQDSMTL